MREIKFRAWHKNDKVMWFPTLIDVAPDWDDRALYPYGDENNVPHYPKDCELMQFTGLKDSNGKEIYERDLLGVWEKGLSGSDRCIYEVRWRGEEDYPAFDLMGWPNEEVNALSELIQSGDWEYEVVGNIFERPTILTS
jgi:hypothetical protein